MELHDYQKRAVEWMKDHGCGYLAVDMGLGKTRCMLELISKLRAPAIVVAPLRVALHTWPAEIKKWTPELSYKVLHGPDKALRLNVASTDVFIINYDGLKWLATQRKETLRGRVLILDEATAIKSHKSQRTKILALMRPLFNRCYCLSATPSPNGIQDLWSQYRVLDQGERLGKRWGEFFFRYFNQDKFYRVYPKDPCVVDVILSKVADCTFRLDSNDYLQLPDFVYNDIELELPRSLRAKYKDFENDFMLELDNTTVTAMSAATLSMKLRQFIQGCLYTYDLTGKCTGYEKVHSLKLDALETIMEQLEGQPNLVAINFKFELEEIEKRFKGKYKALVGGIPAKESVKIIDQWNKGELPMLVVHPAAVSHGINLQAGGHHITWQSLTWNYEHYTQLNGRLRRQGQMHPVVLTRLLLGDTIDSKIAKALATKGANQESVLKALK